MVCNKFVYFIDVDPDPELDRDPHTINPDSHHCSDDYPWHNRVQDGIKRSLGLEKQRQQQQHEQLLAAQRHHQQQQGRNSLSVIFNL